MELHSDFLSDEVKSIGWIDIHTHLNFLDVTPERAVAEAKDIGIKNFITIGTEPKDHGEVLAIANRLPEVACTLGVHPHEGQLYDDNVENYLLQHLGGARVVAVGEIGLDYYYDNCPRATQLDAFRRQMSMAQKFNMPVEIHTRDAEPDTIEVLKEYSGKVSGLIHCFTGTQELATAALDCGFNLSFSGIVTFKNAESLRAVVQRTPLDRLHVETDAPFLAPNPLRGRQNHPKNMLWTANMVAHLKATAIPEFCWQMKSNALKMFPKLAWLA